LLYELVTMHGHLNVKL